MRYADYFEWKMQNRENFKKLPGSIIKKKVYNTSENQAIQHLCKPSKITEQMLKAFFFRF